MERILSYGSRFAIPAAILLAGAQRHSILLNYADQSAIYDVKGGTRAVIFDRLSGVKKDVVEEGTHFLIPWLQKAVIYDVRTKPRNISTTTGSKDLQMVSLTLRVLHRPNVVELPRIYQV
jgi:prohibitin 1